MGEASALLFPIDWPEPFGLVMIEAMACGTPVIAYPRGSVPEVLEDGVTGWIVESLEEAVQAVERVPLLSRSRCRQVFEERFAASRMVQDYVKLYRQLLAPRAVVWQHDPSASSNEEARSKGARSAHALVVREGTPAYLLRIAPRSWRI